MCGYSMRHEPAQCQEGRQWSAIKGPTNSIKPCMSEALHPRPGSAPRSGSTAHYSASPSLKRAGPSALDPGGTGMIAL